MTCARIANGNFYLDNVGGALTIIDTRNHTEMTIDKGDFESFLSALCLVGVNETVQRTRPTKAAPRRRLV